MPNSYDVDDILEEIKRKKSAKSAQEHNAQRMKPTAWDRVETPAPVNTPAPEQVQQASSLEGLADFFGSNAKFDIGRNRRKRQKRRQRFPLSWNRHFWMRSSRRIKKA